MKLGLNFKPPSNKKRKNLNLMSPPRKMSLRVKNPLKKVRIQVSWASKRESRNQLSLIKRSS